MLITEIYGRNILRRCQSDYDESKQWIEYYTTFSKAENINSKTFFTECR